MSQVTSPASFDRLLFLLRKPLAVIALLFILYCIVYLWLFIPYEDFSYHWRPDSVLVVRDVPADSLAFTHLQPGDQVLAIGGHPVRRMQTVYPLPVQGTYQYQVLRAGEILETTVSFSDQITPLTFQLRLPATVLSLAGWLVGTIIFLLAKSNNIQALRAGSIFILGAMVVIGIQASLNGVPGTWIVGYTLSFILVPAWVYLGLIPRLTPLSLNARRFFKLMFVIATILALLASFEVLFLYPQPTSFQELLGVSIYSLSFLLTGLGLLACVIILASRALALPSGSYLRQQLLILLAFFGLGILPTVLLTLVPAALFNTPLLPFELAIFLMLLIPAGYLFVIYRRGFMGLDLFFSRSLHLILLTLVVFGFYAATLYLVQRLLDQNSAELLLPATLVFLPTILLAMYMNKPVSDFVDRLVYGGVVSSQHLLANYTQALSSRPELGTLDNIVASLANSLSSSRASLALQDPSGRLTLVSLIGLVQAVTTVPDEWPELEQPVLRSVEGLDAAAGQLFRLFSWAEILVPVKVRNEQIGILALSRPGPDGYYNFKQVSFLTQAAGVLAVGIENIYLFDSTRKHSRQRLLAQEEARKKLSRQLHDEPLQQVTYAVSVIDHLLAKYNSTSGEAKDGAHCTLTTTDVAARLQVTADYLRKAAVSLRNVCIGLYPPFYDQGVELAVSEIIRQFEADYGLDIEYATSLTISSRPTSEQLTATVARVLAEALNNVLKHAEGAEVEVKLESTEDWLTLLIADNGPGSRAATLSFSELVRQGHLGIVGMHEWAQEVGGTLEVLPNEPSGTCVFLQCPV